ncbi:hypothetical protein [Actinomyces vulturis]|uniref:hypothetical protein n=1 Tax=Actinomyces vulturis TaxID=1857645 RepID=UPI00159ED019|nr:hypothetical protein [Actinomyces vulturis]
MHVDCIDNDVIVRTLAGAARSVANAVDQAHWPGVLGTIAGNDSLIIVCESQERAMKLCADFPRGVYSDGYCLRLVDYPLEASGQINASEREN